VRVDLDDFLLVGGEFFCVALLRWSVSFPRMGWKKLSRISHLQTDQHGVCLIHQANYHGSLLHCFLCILHLEYPALWRAVPELAAGMDPSRGMIMGSGLQGDGIIVVVVAEHGERDA
jgi:hypothetical protein